MIIKKDILLITKIFMIVKLINIMLGKVQRIAPAYLEYLNSGFKTFYKNILYNYFVFYYSNSYFTRT